MGRSRARPAELIRLYDTISSNYNEMLSLHGISSDKALTKDMDGLKAWCEAQ